MMTSQSSSIPLLTFCYDCGCLRLRDVTSQLQELFSKRSINLDLCGICRKYVQADNIRIHEEEEGDSKVHEQAKPNQDEAGHQDQNNSNMSPVVSTLVKHNYNDLNQSIKHDLDCQVETLDDADDVDSGGGMDECDDDDDDGNNYSTGDTDTISINNVALGSHSVPGNTSDSNTSNDAASINLTGTSTKSSLVVSRKGLRRKKVAPHEVKSKPSTRSKTNKGRLDAGATLHQKTRVTRLSSGVIKAANYQSLFEGDGKSGDSEEGEEKDVEEENKKEEEEEYRASDDDYKPQDSDGGNEDDADDHDIDISQYIHVVEKNENKPTDNTWFGRGVEALVPEMQELVELEAAAAAGGGTSLPQFTCKLCGDKFRFISQFHKHLQAYHIEEAGKIGVPFVCIECGKKFAKFKYLTKHKYRHAKEFVSYKCTHKNCSFTFSRRNSLISHIEVHKGKRKLMCKNCGIGFHDDRSLSIHVSLHSNQKKYSCQYCSKPFSHKSYLKNHERQVHSGAFKCNLCPYVGSRKINLEKHKRVHQETGHSYECKQCNCCFKQKGSYDRHVKSDKCKPLDLSSLDVIADLNEMKKNLNSRVIELMAPITNMNTPFKCKHCPMGQFRFAMHFLKHLKKSHLELHPDIDSVMKEPFKCSDCDKLCASLQQLYSHQITHVKDRSYKCQHPGCDKTFKSKDQVRNHIIIHREREFMCSQCGGRFQTKQQLEHHRNSVHLKLRPHPCPHCGRAFSAKGKLTVHVNRVHLKLKPYVCDKCGRALASPADFKQHLFYHTGEKPYKCDQCDYRCVRGDYLTKHKRTHTGERPYHCDLCNTAFAHRTQFVAHQRKNHGINVSSASNASSYQAANNIPVSSSDIRSGSNISVNVKNELESKTAVEFLHENFSF